MADTLIMIAVSLLFVMVLMYAMIRFTDWAAAKSWNGWSDRIEFQVLYATGLASVVIALVIGYVIGMHYLLGMPLQS